MRIDANYEKELTTSNNIIKLYKTASLTSFCNIDFYSTTFVYII